MTAAQVEPEPCHRCHGTGVEPAKRQPTLPEHEQSQRELLELLQAAGARRAQANRHTLDGRRALDQAYQDIRVHGAEAERLKLTRNQVAQAVGVSRSQLFNIMNGKTQA